MDPKELLQDPEQIKNLITLLQSLLPNKEEVEEDKPVDKKTKKRTKKKTHDEDNGEHHFINNNIKTRNKRYPKTSSVNKFEKMSEFTMHKDDTQIDKQLAKHPPVARTREFDPVSVTCRICGKKDVVSPSLVHEGPSRYKCNNCSTQAG